MSLMDFLSISGIWAAASLGTFAFVVILFDHLLYPLVIEFPKNIVKFFRRDIGFFKLIDPIVKFAVWFMSLFAVSLLTVMYFKSVTYFITFNIMIVSFPLKLVLAAAFVFLTVKSFYNRINNKEKSNMID